MSGLQIARNISLLLLFVVSLTGSLAEVAVAVDGSSTSLYIVAGIVDDPSPTNLVWQRNNPDSPSRFVLNDQGVANGDGKPSIAFNKHTSIPVVAWARNSPDGFDVVVSRFAGGAWTEPAVLASSPDNELDPFLTIDPDDGSVHLFYCIDGTSPRIMHRTAPADLSAWSPPLQVTTPGELPARPSATFVDGELQVVYENHPFGYGSTPREIVLVTFDGQGFSGGVLVTTTYPEPSWPEIHYALGRSWIEWIDEEGEMAWMWREVPGVWQPILTESFDTAEKRDYHVRGTIKARALE